MAGGWATAKTQVAVDFLGLFFFKNKNSTDEKKKKNSAKKDKVATTKEG